MRRLVLGLMTVCAIATLLFAGQVPRQAAEFTFSLPGGKQASLERV